MTAKFRACFCLLLLPVFALPAMVTAEDDETSLEFRDESFELAFVKEKKEGKFHEILNEYIPEEEDLEEWSAMIAVRKYPGRTDFEQLAKNVVKVLKEQNPDAPYELQTLDNGKRTMIDFITWDLKEEIIEFNVFIYELGGDGESILCKQYALRSYGQEEGMEFLDELKPLRPEILKAVTKFKFPKITTKQPEEAEAE